jgi:hypothetical protein
MELTTKSKICPHAKFLIKKLTFVGTFANRVIIWELIS